MKKKKIVKPIKRKKPVLNELILDTYCKVIHDALKSGKKPDKVYTRLTEMIDDYNEYKNRNK
jgi:hypothetical protein